VCSTTSEPKAGEGGHRIASLDRKTGSRGEGDLAGRDRLVGNVLGSWAAQLVFIVAGFLLPRVIDRHVGQEALGVWDFSWSLVSYFGLVQVGIVASVNCYVARNRAAGNLAGLNSAVSSVTCLLIAMAATVLMLATGAVFVMPILFRDSAPEMITDAKWVVFLNGAGLAVQIAFSAFNSVLTGCFRYGIANAICAGTYAATAACMIAALVLGGGLRSLALVHLGGEALLWGMVYLAAHRVCPGLRVRLSSARWSVARDMAAFGGKMFMFTVSDLLQGQAAGILIAVFLGPAVLALYSRAMALIRNTSAMVGRLATVLTPMASSLETMGEQQELRGLLVKATRYVTYSVVPVVLTLCLLGGAVLRVWMGANYEQDAVLAILAIGHFAAMFQRPAFNIMVGLNLHGRLGLVNLAAAILSAALMAAALGWLRAGLEGVALALVVPLTLANGIYTPMCTCRRVGLPFGRYVFQSLKGPILCAVPFGACLLAARITFADRAGVALAVGVGTGGLVLAPLYWRYALPPRLKEKLRKVLSCVYRACDSRKTLTSAPESGKDSARVAPQPKGETPADCL